MSQIWILKMLKMQVWALSYYFMNTLLLKGDD